MHLSQSSSHCLCCGLLRRGERDKGGKAATDGTDVTITRPGMPGTTLKPGECTTPVRKWCRDAHWPGTYREGFALVQTAARAACHVRRTASLQAPETLAERVICVVWAPARTGQRSVAWKLGKGISTSLTWGEGRVTLTSF